MKSRLSLFCLLFTMLTTAVAQSPVDIPNFLDEDQPKPKILLIGTFHFADAGLDWFKPTDIDVMTPQRQAEIEEVVNLIAAFHPTKVALEWKPQVQPKVDSLYQEYLDGNFQLKSNEVYQLGFRLARQASAGLYCVDAKGRHYPDVRDVETVALENGQAYLGPIAEAWDARYKQLYTFGDSLKQVIPIRDYLLYLNSPERLRKGHGHYVYRALAVGDSEEYPVVDNVTGWYNRNLRIFANLLRLIESEDDRIVLIIGAGHIPIMQHAAGSCPDIELIDVSEVLGRGRE